MGSEGKSRKRRSSPSPSPSPSSQDEEERSRKQRKREERERKSRRDVDVADDDDEKERKRKMKREKKGEESHKHSRTREGKDKKSREKHKHKKYLGPIVELSKDDYFSKNNEFSTWLKEEKGKYFSDLSSEAARDLFSRFIKEWNGQKLKAEYYEGGIASAPRTTHNWKIRQEK
ncbi:putative splicing regulatory glutamine/lysine-rich protein 1 [Iris pallida]|uniref:Splicing regulatory glutamine/lysine-rich protein 1 n=1 Tax=Iris pallida TaxID=29817 RepID=A0AAX6DLV7_IRIPA|nr:putative splicing regulatory glutamine/lysine-rich protein 1 [Iris pallida]